MNKVIIMAGYSSALFVFLYNLQSTWLVYRLCMLLVIVVIYIYLYILHLFFTYLSIIVLCSMFLSLLRLYVYLYRSVNCSVSKYIESNWKPESKSLCVYTNLANKDDFDITAGCCDRAAVQQQAERWRCNKMNVSSARRRRTKLRPPPSSLPDKAISAHFIYCGRYIYI